MRPDAMAGPMERNFKPANAAMASEPFDVWVCAAAARGHIIDDASTTRRIDIVVSFLPKNKSSQASGAARSWKLLRYALYAREVSTDQRAYNIRAWVLLQSRSGARAGYARRGDREAARCYSWTPLSWRLRALASVPPRSYS